MEREEVKPLFLFMGNNIKGTTDDYQKVPLTAASQPVHTTKERVAYFLENPEEAFTTYPETVILLKDKYRQRITHLIDYPLYDMPDVN
jgi:hypothetical protein